MIKLEFQLAVTTISLLLISYPQVIITSTLDSDTNALLEFAEAVPHARSLNWNASNPVCNSWVGITCTLDGTRVTGVHLPGIGLYGPIPNNTIGKLNYLRVLSLRSNYLNGDLPADVLSIPSLQALYLQHNNFSGSIPLSLSPRLGVIDLSFNSLTGDVPPSMVNLSRLFVLNLSYNLLSGSIPQSLDKFPASSFIGNANLCGSPLNPCSVSSPSPAPGGSARARADSRKLNAGSISAISIGGGFLIFVILTYVLCCLKKKREGDEGGATRVIKVKSSDGGKIENLKSEDFGSGVQGAEKIKLVVFEGCSLSFDLEDLLRASAEVLGKGTYGTTYKAILDEATTVAVKRLKEVGVGKKEFDEYMELVNRLGRHPNVVPLLAYYCSKDEKLLVYEYMPGSSLSAALHGTYT